MGKIHNALERYRKERRSSAQAAGLTKDDLNVLARYDSETGKLDLSANDPATLRRLIDAGMLSHDGIVTRSGRRRCEKLQFNGSGQVGAESTVKTTTDEPQPQALQADGSQTLPAEQTTDLRHLGRREVEKTIPEAQASATTIPAQEASQMRRKTDIRTQSKPADREQPVASASVRVLNREKPGESERQVVGHDAEVIVLGNKKHSKEKAKEPSKKDQASAKKEFEELLTFDPNLLLLTDPNSFEAEQFKILRSNILFPKSGKPPKSILVASVLPGEGKSFTATNLALSVAMNIDRHVLLVDCDLRNPTMHLRFGVQEAVGLSDYLAGADSLEPFLFKTRFDKLTVLPAGRASGNPSELLSSQRMLSLLEEMKQRYDDRLIVLDSPPLRLTAEAGVLAKHVDGVLLVVKYGSTPREAVMDLLDQIGSERFLGCVMNSYDMRSAPYLGKSSYGGDGKYYGRYYHSYPRRK